MPAQYWIHDTNSVLLVRYSGVLTDSDALSAVDALRREDSFSADAVILLDTRGVTEVRVTNAGVRQLVARTTSDPAVRRAILAGSGGAMFGLSRMFELMSDASPDALLVSDSMDQVLAWLGLPADFQWPSRAPDAHFESA